MSYELLSAPIRKFVFDKKWKSLRPIQDAAIKKIIQTDLNYILASRTASGKTEAAFLPVLSKADFDQEGVQVLYISPLIALINDQFVRLEELCEYLEVKVVRWHGEASKSQKEKLLKDSRAVVLITPESIEAMLANSQVKAKKLFGHLQFVIIDEVHSFIGSDRGTQLSSLLHRLQQISSKTFQVIGLSATIGDYTEAKSMTNDAERTTVLLDNTPRETEVDFKYFESGVPDYPPTVIDELYADTKDNKVLIFPNSRGKCEEISVRLSRLSKKRQGHTNYFSHHSSVDKALREYIEGFAKKNIHAPFSIACTSTLELGIDIGSVDRIIQVDATYSIASLIQRVGRSGRREGGKGRLTIYATRPFSLLQSLACWTLYKEGYIEKQKRDLHSYDILLHQLLSIVKQQSGQTKDELLTFAQNNPVFKSISTVEVTEIIDHLLATDILEKVGDDLIVGLTGEHWVNHYEFYSVFVTNKGLKVVHDGNIVGEIPDSPYLIEGENILLAARIWKIMDVDRKAAKIKVKPTNDGKKPIFGGEPGDVDIAIRQRMFDLILAEDKFSFINKQSQDTLDILRADFKNFKVTDSNVQRPAIERNDKLELYTFTGTRITRALSFIFLNAGIVCSADDEECRIDIPLSRTEFEKKKQSYTKIFDQKDQLLSEMLSETPSLIEKFKWARLLPLKYQVEILKNRYYNFKGAKEFLERIEWMFSS